MRTASIREAKARLPELIRQVQDGEPVWLTRHGKLVAKLSRCEEGTHVEVVEAPKPRRRPAKPAR